MSKWQSRTEVLIQKKGIDKLAKSKVALFGLGGVGSYCFEALVRAGVGEIHVFDGDEIDESNINRQLLATTQSVGRDKVTLAKERALSINPDVKIVDKKIFYLPENSSSVDLSEFDYVVDAIDTVSAKIELITVCNNLNVPIISCMGTGNKMDATAFKVADIYKTKTCPLARVIRRELKQRGINSLKVVYSEEEPIIKERTPASISYVPSVAGLIIAGEVIKELIKEN